MKQDGGIHRNVLLCWVSCYRKMRDQTAKARARTSQRSSLYRWRTVLATRGQILESEDNIINPTPPHESGKDEPSTRTNNVNNLATPGRKPAKRSRVGSSPPQTNSPVA